MANLKLTLNSNPFDTAEINGKEYKLYYDDESLNRYQKQVKKYEKKATEHAKKLENIDGLSEKELQKHVDESNVFAKELFDTFLGDGAFEVIYEQAGKSLINLMPVVEMLLEWTFEKTNRIQEKQDYYTKKNKK